MALRDEKTCRLSCWVRICLGLIAVTFVCTATRAQKPLTTAPVPTFRATPQYPEALLKAKVEGEATVEFDVDTKGNVAEARVVQASDRRFGQAAVDAMLKWKFIPARKDGRNIAVTVITTVLFRLKEVSPGQFESTIPPIRVFLPDGPQPTRPASEPHAVYPFFKLFADKRAVVKAKVVVGPNGRVDKLQWRGTPSEAFRLAVEAMLDAHGLPKLASGAHSIQWQFDPETGIAQLDEPAKALLHRLRAEGETGFFQEADLSSSLELVERIEPVFPTRLPANIISGSAIIEYIVDENGQVQLPRVVLESDPAFGYAACQALSGWRFKPPMRYGKPVPVRGRTVLNFTR